MPGVAGAIARNWWRSSLASKCEVQGWSLCGFLSHTTDDLHSRACRVYTSMEEIPGIYIYIYISAAPAAKEKHACVKQQWSLSLSENIFIISTFLISELLKCSWTRFLDGWRKPSRRKHQKAVLLLCLNIRPCLKTDSNTLPLHYPTIIEGRGKPRITDWRAGPTAFCLERFSSQREPRLGTRD